MEGYEGMSMPPYLGSPVPMANLEPETYQGGLPSLGIPEPVGGAYDTPDFGLPDDMPWPQSMPQDPQFDSYEEPFTSTSALLDAMPPDQPIPGAASIDRDNKLLSFQMPTYNFTLLDYSLRRTSVSLTAQLHGMFFMAEPQSSSPPDTSRPSTELTCYRRNLFQITGSITLPRMLRYIVTERGERIPIVGQELHISATESVEGHPVKLISVPWKTPVSNSQTTPEDKTEKEPSSIPLDTMSNQDMDADYATFPIAWKRLQFRIATANNGRRKELQQHFVVRLKVVATLATGAKVSICEARSGAIIVRGRSPRNFQQRKDHPVGGTGSNRKPAQPSLTPHSTSDSAHQIKLEKSPDPTVAPLDRQDLQTPSNWPRGGNSIPKSAGASNTRAPSLPTPAFNNTTRPTSNASATPPATRTLSLDSPEPDPTAPRTFKAPRTTSTASTTGFTALPTGIDSADLLYEYFPLGLDDWQPPVDAVYRPHVVHHIAAGGGSGTPGTEGKGGRPGMGGRSKRYFSEDMSK
ncbi:MAG: hypothetical protein LQ342_003573 [Letrouitia transgressa]|nr:MAG: hypothetical protein LQ342_003573 [Letrouitia transgressa]